MLPIRPGGAEALRGRRAHPGLGRVVWRASPDDRAASGSCRSRGVSTRAERRAGDRGSGPVRAWGDAGRDCRPSRRAPCGGVCTRRGAATTSRAQASELARPCPQSALKCLKRTDPVFDHGSPHVLDPSALRDVSHHRGEHRLVDRDERRCHDMGGGPGIDLKNIGERSRGQRC